MSINESDLIARLHAVAEGFEMPPTPPAEDAWRGRRRVRRNRVVVAGAAAAAVAVLIGVTATVAGQDRADTDPVERPKQIEQIDTGIFAEVHGWIVYGGDDGIWAVDPSRPTDQEPKLVTDRRADPLGWSSDGSKLLIVRGDGSDSRYDLIVLDADGTEIRVASGERGIYISGSISPDGSQVIYSSSFSGKPGIFSVGIDGGTPRLLLAPEDRETYFPVFSPDGTQIAYFDGHGDWGHRLRVMNADGTGTRTLDEREGHIRGLAWSPDGQRLLFSDDVGTWVVGFDGSGPTQVVQGGAYPAWSPDGSRIAYHLSPSIEEGFADLCTTQADGTQRACFTRAHLAEAGIQWNPLQLERGAE